MDNLSNTFLINSQIKTWEDYKVWILTSEVTLKKKQLL